MQHVLDKFKDAGLVLVVKDRPIARVSTPIFQMDIKRGTTGNIRNEWFEIFSPAGTIVHVAAISKEWAQLVLAIKEVEQEFEEPINAWSIKNKTDEQVRDWAKKKNPRLKDTDIVKRGSSWFIKNKTTGRTRYFLLGRDERQLFMCQLPGVATSVKQAHASLKAPIVTLAEGRQAGRTIRQGEWFFVNATDKEVADIEKLLKANKLFIQTKVNIGRVIDTRASGNPHTADEVVVVPGFKLVDYGWAVRNREIFVRGKVRHKDHETVNFLSWRKVIRNREVQSQGSIAGGTWID
jgi:hypothetical protein